MKQLFRCEYCTEVGTEEEIQKHEQKCIYNYNRKSCLTCKHRVGNFLALECSDGKEIPGGNYIENCSSYTWDEKDHTKFFRSPFGNSLF